MTTIHFNTSRLYQAHGQRITVHVQPDGSVLFMDHSRGIGGCIREKHHPLTMEVRHLVEYVMGHYDHRNYDTSAEALSLTWDPSQEHLFRI